jgi:hypothetical protein
MVNLSDAVRLLRAQRKELSDQLDAVDKALAALGEPRGVRRPDSARGIRRGPGRDGDRGPSDKAKAAEES